MEERELIANEEAGAGPWLWLALGCGGLVLLGLCLVPPAVIFLSWQAADRGVEPIVTAPDPLPGPEPTPVPDPIAPPGPATPPGSTAPPGAGPPPGTPAPPPPRPRQITVRITESTGLSEVAVGSTCTFPVTRHPNRDGTFWCRAVIECGGRVLYGRPGAGYFDCTLYDEPERHVVGQDVNTTSGDRDAAMRLDTLRGALEVRDDASGPLGAFTVRGTVTGVR